MRIRPITDLPAFGRTVKAIGRANTASLGFLPSGAFDQYLSQGTVLVAVDDNDECVGYLLWRISQGQARIVHLCVRESARGKGVARALVQALHQRTQGLQGISLWCRRDFSAHQMWPKLGFTPRIDKPGRSRSGSELTFWWLDHNHPTIFTYAERERLASKVSVVLDANIFFDLNVPSQRYESMALEADWLEDILEICVTDEIYTEIDRNQDAAERRRLQGAVSKYTLMHYEQSRFLTVFRELAPFFASRTSESSLSDRNQVAKAIAADARFFTTRDYDLLKLSDAIYKAYGITIIRPSDIVVYHDELRRELEYQPARMAGTLLDIRRVQAHEQKLIADVFAGHTPGENQATFSATLRRYLVTPEHADCLVALDTSGDMLAVMVLEWQEGELKIPLLRVRKHPLASTLARHLVLRATYQSSRRQNNITRMTDLFSGEIVASALSECGFTRTLDDWLKVNLAVAASAYDVAHVLDQVASKLGKSGKTYHQLAMLLRRDEVKGDSGFMADVEQTLWPVKITDAAMPTYIVPIRPIWAQHLFDEQLANETLFGADPRLALNGEAVYYRSRRPSMLDYPGRILWYVSSDSRYQWAKKIRACSILDEVVIGSAKALFHQYRRLGVYEWEHVLTIAKGNPESQIMALKFSHTELFTGAVTWDDLQELLHKTHGHGSQIQSPVKVTNDLFYRLYKLGTAST